MAGSRKTPKQLKQEMEALKAQMRDASEREEAVFGKMARKAGVFELDIDDSEMQNALNDLVARFRKSQGAQASNGRASAGSEDQSAATSNGSNE